MFERMKRLMKELEIQEITDECKEEDTWETISPAGEPAAVGSGRKDLGEVAGSGTGAVPESRR